LSAHDRQGSAGHVQRPEQGGLDLGPEVLGGDLLEEAGLEVAGIVDHHVDAAEPLDGCLDGRLGGGGVGHVERNCEEVLVLALGGGDLVGVASGADHRMAGCECGLGDVDAHPASGTGDEPNLLGSHESAPLEG
jgi:hypothetical protein